MLQELSDAQLEGARAFADEVVSFFEARRRPEWTTLHTESEEYRSIAAELDQELIQQGWYVLHWPPEYGGQGDFIRYAILRELSGYYRAPSLSGHGRFIIGPALIRWGTPEQCERFLPSIANAASIFCLGYTEPDAGSDLGALQASAVRDGDEYVVNGQKTFITHSHYADMMFLAAVTDPDAPKYRNMSLFLVDMDLPGISMSPLMCLTGEQVNAVFLDDVRLPAEALVGTEDNGFYHLAMALNFERSGLEKPAQYMGALEEVAEEARRLGLWSDPSVRERVGRLAAEIEAWSSICWRVIDLQSRGEVPSWEASLSELYRKDINPEFGRLLFEIFGYRALRTAEDAETLLGGYVEWLLREGFNNHGQGGRFVTRNAIARRGLGLEKTY